MKKTFLFVFISCISVINSFADRMYIMNSPGYNAAGAELLAEIGTNGHTMVINNSTFVLPPGFTSTCVDPINGYDWLCFFGDNDFTGLIPQIQAFIDAGGKVFYQYEVSCCTQSSLSASIVASALTGLPITENANSYIAINGGVAGWESAGQSCCVDIYGAAYKGLDGLPVANQLQATATLPGGNPPISTCLNYGFHFSTTDFASGANQGGIIGVGDVNLWYDGNEPFSNGGVIPPNPLVVDYFFPGPGNTCYLFPPGCMQSFVNQSFLVDLGNDTSICSGSAFVLNATTAGGTYIWQDGSTNSTFNVTTAGTYYVQVTNNCGVASDTIHINFTAGPVVNLGNDTLLCNGDVLLLDATTAGATYLWQDNSTNPTFNVTTQGTYWVTVSTGAACSTTDSIVVNYTNTVSVNLGNDISMCSGNNLVLNGTTPGATYLWQDNSTNPTLNVNTTGTYWVQVTNNCGVANDSIDVIFNPSPTVSLGVDTLLCPGVIFNFDVTTAGATYQWQDNTTSPTYAVSQSGIYWVQLTVNSCSDIDSATITYLNLNPTQLPADTILCDGETMLLDVTSPGSNYIWQDNSTNSSFNVNSVGTYWVRISNACGIVTDSIYVGYKNCDCDIYVPNAFTPNVDEINPQFYPQSSCHLLEYHFSIYDRWGREIFVTTDPLGKWDGTINGTPAQIGVYAYRITYQFDIPHFIPQTMIGHVNLLR